jgi:hypothetical protein
MFNISVVQKNKLHSDDATTDSDPVLNAKFCPRVKFEYTASIPVVMFSTLDILGYVQTTDYLHATNSCGTKTTLLPIPVPALKINTLGIEGFSYICFILLFMYS